MGGEPTAKRKAQKGQAMSTTTTSNEMTMRQYHEAVIAIPGASADVVAKAKAEIIKLDATNAKRVEKQSAKAKENEPLKVAIYEYLLANGTKTSPEIALALTTAENEVSTSKASSMCRQMVEEGRLSATEVKVPKKGKLKAYTAIPPMSSGEDDPIQVTDAELNSMF